MVTWNLKSCPRCGSDMYVEKDFDTVYKQCLMCGYKVDLERVSVKQPVGAGDYFYDDEDENEYDE